MNNNKARLGLRALAQPTTYLGVAMLAFIFAALSYLLIQSRTVEEDVLVLRDEKLFYPDRRSMGGDAVAGEAMTDLGSSTGPRPSG